MQSQFYFLSPVQVVKVTSQNMQEVAEWCGGDVLETESRRVSGRMDPYVLIPTPKNSRLSWAFPGMFVTKRLVITIKGELKATWAVFQRDYFDKNYFESTEAASKATWDREEYEASRPDGFEHEEPTAVALAMKRALDSANAKVAAMTAKLEEAGLDAKGRGDGTVASPMLFSEKTRVAQVGDNLIPITEGEEKDDE